MPALGAAAWSGALLARGGTLPLVGAGLAGAMLVVLVARRHRQVAGRGQALSAAAVTLAGAVLVLTAAGCVTLVRAAQMSGGPVATLARSEAAVQVEGTVVADPRLLEGRFGRQVLVRLEVRRVEGRAGAWRTAAPVLVLSDDDAWRDARLGGEVRAEGRLLAADDDDVAALLRSSHGPTVVAAPDLWWRAADAVRGSLRRSVAGRPVEQRALVPALVDGDDAGVAPGLAEDFRATGLTHLTATIATMKIGHARCGIFAGQRRFCPPAWG